MNVFNLGFFFLFCRGGCLFGLIWDFFFINTLLIGKSLIFHPDGRDITKCPYLTKLNLKYHTLYPTTV